MSESLIYKFPFGEPLRYEWPAEFHLKVPVGSELLHIGFDKPIPVGAVCAWMKFPVENEHKTWTQVFFVVVSGESFTLSGDHIATVVAEGFVWHIFRGPVYESGEDVPS